MLLDDGYLSEMGHWKEEYKSQYEWQDSTQIHDCDYTK